MGSAREAIGSILSRLEKHELSIFESIALSSSLAQALANLARSTQKGIEEELREISASLDVIKGDIASLRANELRSEHLPTAERELDAVVSVTEDAAHAIMTAAETIANAEASDPVAYKQLVDEQVTRIFEACAFQDIAGQRLVKVAQTLKLVEERIERFVGRSQPGEAHLADAGTGKTPPAASQPDSLLNGPAAPGTAISQDAVDALFSDS